MSVEILEQPSPAPVEDIDELDFEPLKDIEAIEKPDNQVPTGKALKEFTDEILRAPLPPEIAKKVERLRQEKSNESLDQQQRLAELIADLEHGMLGRWVKDGHLAPPDILKEQEQKLEEELTKALEIYSQSEDGERDTKIKALRVFLSSPSPTKAEVTAMGKVLNISQKKITLPGSQAKYAQTIRTEAEASLNRLAPSTDNWSDRQNTWQEMAQDELRVFASLAVDQAIRMSSDEYERALKSFNERYSNTHSADWTLRGRLPGLRKDLEALDKSQQDSVKNLVVALSLKGNIFSAISRGSTTVKQVIKMIQEQPSVFSRNNGRNLQGIFEEEINKEWKYAMNCLPSPSLVGLSYTEKEFEEVKKCLEDIAHLKRICNLGAAHIDNEQNIQQVLRDINHTQKLFFERLDTPNSLYWHFTRKGLDIMSSREVQSGELVEQRNTGDFSKGIHFVKPGLGIETRLQYHTYAQGDLSNAVQKLSQPFGLAVIYRLGDIMKTTPLRDEPLADPHKGVGNVSDDVTFRPLDESAEYVYPLKQAYLLPIASWEQLELVKSDPRFTNVLNQPPGTPPYRLAKEVAIKTLREAGFSEDWIKTHLLDSESLVDTELVSGRSIGKGLEHELFSKVGQAITNKLSRDIKMIVPLNATKGQFEPHDSDGGSMPELWKEELVELEIA